MGQGLFVALEGIDGSGTSTQSQRLGECLRRDGRAVHLTREPSDGPVGSLIRQVLRGRIVAAGSTGHPPGWETMALLFAADRMDHLAAEIEPNLQDGVDVITDRYYHSSIAYQAETSGVDGAWVWIRELNVRARRPDLTIILDVEPALAARRRAERASSREIYDDLDLQERLAAFYRKLPKLLASESFAVLDGSGSVEAVHESVVAAVARARERHQR